MKKIRLLMILLVFVPLILQIDSSAEVTYLKKKPILYSRVNTCCSSEDITDKVKKDADKLHKEIMSTTKTKFLKKTYNSKKALYARFDYLFGVYLNYIRKDLIEFKLDYYDCDDKDTGDWSCVKHNKKKGTYTIKLNVSQYKILRSTNKYNRDNVKQALKQEMFFPENCTEEHAIQIICDWICAKDSYDYESRITRYHIFFTFRDRLVICTGYADTFQIIANELGINSWTASSDVHEWNRVIYNQKIMYVDVCWEDCTGDRSYTRLTPEELIHLQMHELTEIGELKTIMVDKRNFKNN